MEVEEAIAGQVKDLYRAQAFVIDTYESRTKDERLPENLRNQIQEGLNDHYRHKDKLENLIKELGQEVPSASLKMSAWISSVKEAVAGKSEEMFRMMQSDLVTEHGLIDHYKVLTELASRNPSVLAVCTDNMTDDEGHARMFEDAAMLFAREMREAA